VYGSGTPALTTRGMKEPDMEKIAEMINDIISNPESDDVKKSIQKRIDDLTSEHPLYPELFTW
jgi:glycine hydroxymethyltransferase